MILISKKKEPRELQEEIGRLKSTPDCTVNYDNISTAAKRAIMTSLLKEQHYLCAYCMRRLHNASNSTSVEHIKPRHDTNGHSNDSDSLRYRNLLAVCNRNDKQAAAKPTCDKSKGNQAITVNPLDARTLSGIFYQADGSISSRDSTVDHDLNAVLNLNGPTYMKRSRQEVRRKIQSKIEEFDTKSPSGKAAECRRLKKLLAEKEKYPEYIGVAFYYLDRFIKKFDQQSKNARCRPPH